MQPKAHDSKSRVFFALCRLGIYVQSFWVIQQNPGRNSKNNRWCVKLGKSDRYSCSLVPRSCPTGCMDMRVGCVGEELGIPEREKGGGGIFWPLVAFTTQAQIIEGHGNLSDRWTMLPFSNPLWTGPSIMGEEINSIHQLFVSLGPLMPPYIAQEGGYKCLWTWSEPACLTPN